MDDDDYVGTTSILFIVSRARYPRARAIVRSKPVRTLNDSVNAYFNIPNYLKTGHSLDNGLDNAHEQPQPNSKVDVSSIARAYSTHASLMGLEFTSLHSFPTELAPSSVNLHRFNHSHRDIFYRQSIVFGTDRTPPKRDNDRLLSSSSACPYIIKS